jgi:hypothetical protein
VSPALRDFWSDFYLSEPHGTPNRPPFWHIVDTAHDGLLAHDWRRVESLFSGAFTGPVLALAVGFVVASVVVAVRRPLYALLFGTPVLIAVVASLARLAPFGGGRVDVWLYAPMTFMVAVAVDVVLGPRRNADTSAPATPRRRSSAATMRGLVVGAGAIGLAVVWMVSIPSPEVFTWPDVVPLVDEMEATRSPRDLVVVSGPLMFNYALFAPQPFTTSISDRNATHFAPNVEGVHAMNWAEFPAPMREFRARLDHADGVWLLDTPEIIYPLGAAPRTELARRGFARVTESRSGGGALEHWVRAP